MTLFSASETIRPSHPTASAQHEKQCAGHDDSPRYTHSGQTRTFRPDASRDARTHNPSLSKRSRRHQDLRHAVRARDIHATLAIRHDLGAGEDIHKQLVRREYRVHFPIYALRALSTDVCEEREDRRFGDDHGVVLYCQKLHLRWGLK